MKPAQLPPLSLPGIKQVNYDRIEWANYIIDGGNGHAIVINGGYPPAGTEIPKLIGAGTKVDYVFPTDCRDIHVISVPGLVETFGSMAITCETAGGILRNPFYFNFPLNSLMRKTEAVEIVDDGQVMDWCGKKLHFYDLPGLGAGRQMMLYETLTMRVLFLGDALIELKRFPFASPFYSCDIRDIYLRRVINLIKKLKPTYIADDWGIRPVKSESSFDAALKWASKFRERAGDVLCEPVDLRRADPGWCMPIPNSYKAKWGTRLFAKVRLRNYNDYNLKMKISLVGEYLDKGSGWGVVIELAPYEQVTLPVEFSVRADCPRTGTAIGIRIEEKGYACVPNQFILMQ